MVDAQVGSAFELRDGARLLDRYVVLDRIGAGGMATIHRATDERLDRIVCVKLLRTTLHEGAGSETGGRAVYEASYRHFLKEALALSRLSHPNTLRIYDFGHVDDGTALGAPFQVSEYLDGGTLESRVRLRGPVPPAETLAILDRIAGALGEAHEQGIVHRDIKPSNILFARVSATLVPKLADFGIAYGDIRRRGAPADAAPPSPVALFSPRWAAPEQLRGAPEGPAADIYALGLLAVYMLTGRMLFGDEDVRVTFAERVRADDLVRTRLVQAGAAGPGGEVLAQALSVHPERRPGSAPELAARLRGAFDRAALERAFGAAEAGSAVRPRARPDAPPAVRAAALDPDEDAPTGRVSSAAARDALGGSPARHGELPVRYVAVHEKLDIGFADRHGGQVRVRITLLPGGKGPRLAVKGLSCFVRRPGDRPSPALTSEEDGVAELVASSRQVVGQVSWWLGTDEGQGARRFLVEGAPLLVPSALGDAVVVRCSGADEIVVVHRHATAHQGAPEHE